MDIVYSRVRLLTPRMDKTIGVCVLVLYFVLCLLDITESTSSLTTTEKPNDNDEKDDVLKESMVVGLGVGLGSFSAVVICCCLFFKCCCKHDVNSASSSSTSSPPLKKGNK